MTSTRTRLTLAAVGVAAAAIVATVIVLPSWQSPAAATVETYLEGLRDKDVDKALDTMNRTSPVNADALDALMTKSALSSDWEIESTSVRDETEPDSTGSDLRDDAVTVVDATIRSGTMTSSGRFRVQESEDEWKILNPLVEVNASGVDMPYLEVNGKKITNPSSGVDATNWQDHPSLLMFPGVHTLFGEDENVTASPKIAMLMPDADDEKPLFLEAETTLTSKGVKTVEDAVHDHIDTCVSRSKPTREDCPFVATDGRVTVYNGETHYNDVEDIAWSVNEYPEITAVPGIETIDLGLVNEPTVTMKASGERSPDDKRVEFTATCPIAFDDDTPLLSNATAELSKSGKAKVTWTVNDVDMDFRSLIYECH